MHRVFELFHGLREAIRVLRSEPPGLWALAVAVVLALIDCVARNYFPGVVDVLELLAIVILLPAGYLVGFVAARDRQLPDVVRAAIEARLVTQPVDMGMLRRNISRAGMRVCFQRAVVDFVEILKGVATGEVLYVQEADYSKWQAQMLSECNGGDRVQATCAEKTWKRGLVRSWFASNFDAAKKGVDIKRGFLELWAPFRQHGKGQGKTGCDLSADLLRAQHDVSRDQGDSIAAWKISASSNNKVEALSLLHNLTIGRAWHPSKFFGFVVFSMRLPTGEMTDKSLLVHWRHAGEMHGVILIDGDTIGKFEAVFRDLEALAG